MVIFSVVEKARSPVSMACCLGGSRAEAVPSFLLASVVGNSGHSLACRPITPESACLHRTFSPVCLSLCLSSYRDTRRIELGPTLVEYDLILTWLHSQNPHFQLKSMDRHGGQDYNLSLAVIFNSQHLPLLLIFLLYPSILPADWNVKVTIGARTAILNQGVILGWNPWMGELQDRRKLGSWHH